MPAPATRSIAATIRVGKDILKHFPSADRLRAPLTATSTGDLRALEESGYSSIPRRLERRTSAERAEGATSVVRHIHQRATRDLGRAGRT